MLSISETKECAKESRAPGYDKMEDCSSIGAIPYFVSFFCLCSFLVSAQTYINILFRKHSRIATKATKYQKKTK
jgi:hypothetical protein